MKEAGSMATPASDQPNNLFAEVNKALQSDDLNSLSWIDKMLKNDIEIEFEPLPLLDEENYFFP